MIIHAIQSYVLLLPSSSKMKIDPLATERSTGSSELRPTINSSEGSSTFSSLITVILEQDRCPTGEPAGSSSGVSM